MELKLAEILKETADQLDLEASITEAYSGRGMMGECTVALVCESKVITSLMYASASAIARAIEAGELEAELDQPIRVDNMGYDTVFY